MSTTTPEVTKKPAKKKGPIRWEAIIPVMVICVLGYVYFNWFFDHHLKKGIEYVGTQANGAEVNVASVKTSFLRASFDLNGLEVTDKEIPKRNLISIQNVHFQYLWDALLRMKFVVNDASINQIQVYSPRKSPGFVLPPEPAKPSKLDEMQKEVIDQVKKEYAQNVLGDLVALLEGADPKDQLEKIREELKSEKRIKEMVQDVETKNNFWKGEVKRLSDTSKIQKIEEEIKEIKAEKNFLKQAQGVQGVLSDVKEIEKQAKEIQSAGKKLESEVKAVTQYPKEVENLVKEDISSLKNRFKIPELDMKGLAMTLFAKEFGGYLVKVRKYEALAKQYLPEKKDREEVLPPPREVGKTFEYPITKSYPLFWLQRAAISSKGTADSYSGTVSGEITDVSTSPKWVKKPTKLTVKGDFPGPGVHGVQAVLAADFSKAVPSQSLDMRVAAFDIPEKMFSQSDSMKFGLTKAIGSTTISAFLQEGQVKMTWNASISKPTWLVQTSSKLAQELLSGIVNGIPEIHVKGQAQGPWKNLDMDIESNLGSELARGMKEQIGKKVAEAETKIKTLVDEKILGPKNALMGQLKGNGDLLSQIKNTDQFYKNNQEKIKTEIAKLQKGGGEKNLKEQGKKLLKGFGL